MTAQPRANERILAPAQMGWDVAVLDVAVSSFDSSDLAVGGVTPVERQSGSTGYKRPHEGTDSPGSAMEAYLEWEYGLVAQLERDGTHGFHVI